MRPEAAHTQEVYVAILSSSCKVMGVKQAIFG